MSERPDPRQRAMIDAYQDDCENAAFASIGGLGARNDPQPPEYILPEEREAYLAGYIAQCVEMYGPDWRTAEFGWFPAMTIGGDEARPSGGKRELTDAELLTNAETMRHILTIRALLAECVLELLGRGDAHDKSKLREPEVDTFVKYTPILAGLTYGSDEYKAALAEMKPALDNHYRCNRHHPEHFDLWKCPVCGGVFEAKDAPEADSYKERPRFCPSCCPVGTIMECILEPHVGVEGMNLFDLLEMLIDWKAATLRHADGDLNESLRKNIPRFNIPEPIARLLANTIPAVQRMAKRANVAASYPHVKEGA